MNFELQELVQAMVVVFRERVDVHILWWLDSYPGRSIGNVTEPELPRSCSPARGLSSRYSESKKGLQLVDQLRNSCPNVGRAPPLC